MLSKNINRNMKNFARKIHYIGQDYYFNNHSKLVENEILKNPKW